MNEYMRLAKGIYELLTDEQKEHLCTCLGTYSIVDAIMVLTAEDLSDEIADAIATEIMNMYKRGE